MAEVAPTDGTPPAWAAWREVVRAMPLGRLVGEIFFWRGSWTQIGSDYVSGLRGSPSMRRVAAILSPLGDDDLRRVHAIARINHKRLEAWARWMAVGFITLPVSVVVTLQQLDAAMFARLRERFDAPTGAALAATAVAVLYQIIAAWRSLRIATAVDFAMVDRGLVEDWSAT